MGKKIISILSLFFCIFAFLGNAEAQTMVSITSYGAVGDGVTDNLPALNRAISDAQSRNLILNIPSGIFAYRGVIRMTGVKMVGSGDASVLYAQDPTQEAIFVYGDGAEIRNLKLTGAKSTSRLAAWETTHITLFGATNFVIDHVTIEGSAAAGIQTANGANHGQITNNTIRNTLADSIHMTDGANNILVDKNSIENSGDDGIAVVSYMSDSVYVHDITSRNNRVINNIWGRNMSVVGGRNILIENNDLEGNPLAACLYLAEEGSSSYNTYGDHSVTAQYNTLKNCGSTTTGHSAVMIYSDGLDSVDAIRVIRNDIYQPSTLTAFRVFGDVFDILLDSNRINGTSHDYDIQASGVTLIRYSSGSVGYVDPGQSLPSTPSYVLSISSPSAGATVSGTIQIKGTAPGMQNVEVFDSSGAFLSRAIPDAAGNFAATVDTTQFSDGVQEFKLMAWDSPPGAAFAHSDAKLLSLQIQNAEPAPQAQDITVLASSPSSPSIRRGQSFNLTFNFAGGPSLVAEKIFVHFVNSSGQIIFGADFDPSTPSTQWSGFSQTRRISVPSGIARGKYRILIGLYDPITGLRLKLKAGSGVILGSDLRYQVGILTAK